MAKGWTRISTVNDTPKDTRTSAEKRNAEKKISNVIRNTKRTTYEGLVKENLVLYNEKKSREDSLLAAYDEKRLKSKEAIKEARRLKMQKENKNKENINEA